MPIWAFFPCSAGEEMVDVHQASKPCPDGHGFDVRGVERWWTLTERRKRAHLGSFSMFQQVRWWTDAKHRNHAQMGIFSMFSGWGGVDRHRASKTCPGGHGFDVLDG